MNRGVLEHVFFVILLLVSLRGAQVSVCTYCSDLKSFHQCWMGIYSTPATKFLHRVLQPVNITDCTCQEGSGLSLLGLLEFAFQLGMPIFHIVIPTLLAYKPELCSYTNAYLEPKEQDGEHLSIPLMLVSYHVHLDGVNVLIAASGLN